jgi:hypothetical protein
MGVDRAMTLSNEDDQLPNRVSSMGNVVDDLTGFRVRKRDQSFFG